MSSFDSYETHLDTIILYNKRLFGLFGCGTKTKTYIRRSDIKIITENRNLNSKLLFVIVILAMIVDDIGHPYDIQLAILIGLLTLYFLLGFFRSGLTFITKYGEFTSGCCVAKNDNIFRWFMGNNEHTASEVIIDMVPLVSSS